VVEEQGTKVSQPNPTQPSIDSLIILVCDYQIERERERERERSIREKERLVVLCCCSNSINKQASKQDNTYLHNIFDFIFKLTDRVERQQKKKEMKFLWRMSVFMLVGIMLTGMSTARFVVEKNSLSVTSPDKIKGKHDSAIGNFGIPQYGGSMAGNVVYPKDNNKGCKDFDDSSSFKSKPGALPTILLLDRGS